MGQKHLCDLTSKGYLKKHLYEYQKIVQTPRYICTKCGRVAGAKKYLCQPHKIYLIRKNT